MPTAKDTAARAYNLAENRRIRATTQWASAHADNAMHPSPDRAQEAARLEARMNKTNAKSVHAFALYLTA